MIVSGVLAALAGQAWWESRQERGFERDYLERMAQELVEDSAQLRNLFLPGTAAKLRAITAVTPYVSGRDTSVPDTLTLIRGLSLAGRFGIGSVGLRRVTFDDLESTGNLRLIHDPALRAKIVSHYSAAEAERERAAARRSGYAMSFSSLIPGELFREGVTLDRLRPYDLERVLTRARGDRFRDLLNQELNYGIYVGRQMEHQSERIDSLLLDIRAALKNTR